MGDINVCVLDGIIIAIVDTVNSFLFESRPFRIEILINRCLFDVEQLNLF
jgi:hypothetical protein